MNLDLIEKHIHLTETATGVIVSFGGQTCLKITEQADGYAWRIEPIFAKLTYGANLFEDVPFSFELYDTKETAIAEGLSALDEMGAFYGIVDTPEDTFGKEGGVDNMTNESVEDLLESGRIISVQQANKEMNDRKKSDEAKRLKDPENTALKHADSSEFHSTQPSNWNRAQYSHYLKTYIGKAGRMALPKGFSADKHIDENLLESIKADCRKEALKHEDNLMEANFLAQALFESFIEELDEGIYKGDYTATAEKSAKGYRPHVVHDNKKTTMYLGSATYKTPEHAKAHAETYLNAYAVYGDKSADRASWAYRNKNKEHLVEEVEQIEELSKSTLGSYAKKANAERSNPGISDDKAENRGAGVMKAIDRVAGYKAGPIKGNAVTARWSASKGLKTATKDKESFERSINKVLKEEELDEAATYQVTHKDGDKEKLILTGTHKETAYRTAKLLKDKNLPDVKLYKNGKVLTEELDEAAPDERAKALSPFATLAKKGSSEPVAEKPKGKRGRPTNIDHSELHARAKENVDAGKRPTAGFGRNEKLIFIRNLKDHKDFAGKHVSAAGRTHGTTNAAKAEKEVAKKKEVSSMGVFGGLIKK